MSPIPSPWTLAPWTAADWANHLWQSTVVALALLLLLVFCRRVSARTRLAIAWLAIGKFAVPLAALGALKDIFLGAPPPVAMPPATALAATQATAIGLAPLPPEPAATLFPLMVPISAPGASVLLGLWLAGFVALGSGWSLRAWRARRRQLAATGPLSPAVEQAVREAASAVGLSRPPSCLSSASGQGPALCGLLAPVIILPRGLEDALTREEFHAVLVHELMHLRWRDHLAGAFQALMVGLLWFNPVAWLLSRRLSLETEKACDERVVALTGDAEAYASGIVKTVRLSLGLPAPGVLGVTTPPVVSRLQDILEPRPRYRSRPYHVLAVAVAIALAGLGVHTGALLAQAVAAEPAFAPLPAAIAPSTPSPTAESRPTVTAQAPLMATPAASAAAPLVAPTATPAASKPKSKSSDDATLSIDFRDTEIRELLSRIADLFEINLVIPDTLRGKTSVTLTDVTWRQIFKTVLEPVGYTFVNDGALIRIIAVAPAGSPPLKSETPLTPRAVPGSQSMRTPVPVRDYVLKPDDVLNIQVFQRDDLSEKNLRLAGDSTIHYAPLGRVDLLDKTTRQTEQMLREQLAARGTPSPYVNVTVAEYHRQTAPASLVLSIAADPQAIRQNVAGQAKPTPVASAPLKGQAIISIDKEGTISLSTSSANPRAIADAELPAVLEQIKQSDRDTAVLIRADETTQLKKLAYVMDCCRKAGLTKFSLESR